MYCCTPHVLYKGQGQVCVKVKKMGLELNSASVQGFPMVTYSLVLR